jgi:hypothetical protein
MTSQATTGLFDCGFENGAAAFFCPACTYGRLTKKFTPDELSLSNQERTSGILYHFLSPFGLFSACLCVVPLNVLMRSAMNSALALTNENTLEVCCIATFCSCCSLAQIQNNMDAARPNGAPSATSANLASNIGVSRMPRPQRMQRMGPLVSKKKAKEECDFCSNIKL